MAADVSLDPAAEADLQEIYWWYSGDRPGRVARFTASFERCLEGIAASPIGHRIWHGRFRRVNLRKFPYFVVYEVDDTQGRVLAVGHSARDQRPLRGRLDDRDAS